MIDLGALLNGRWTVERPFDQGVGRNFVLFIVADEHVPGRRAVVKTVRKADLPAPELYAWRRRALREEIGRAGALVHPALPEPLDAFTLPDGEPAVVYALVGGRPGLGSLPRPAVPGFLWRLALVTEGLWRAGFVHVNLNPDHLVALPDAAPRLTGLSAVCRHDGARVAGAEPGLRNLCVGYHAAGHHAHVAARSEAPLPAARLRWYGYAALALELIAGLDVRGRCRARGAHGLELDDDDWAWSKQQILSGMESGAAGRVAGELLARLRACLEGAPPRDLLRALGQLWGELTLPPGTPPAPASGAEGVEVLVGGPEEAASVPARDGGRRPVGRYAVTDPGGGAGLLQAAGLGQLWCPGDRLPGAHAFVDAGARRPVLFPDGWAALRAEAAPGAEVRALSLGRRRRAARDAHRSDPWARVEVDGAWQACPIRPAGRGEKFVVYPRAGAFFRGECRGDGVAPLAAPDVRGLVGRREVAAVCLVYNDFAFFDLPLGPDHLVTCLLPRCRWGGPVFAGKEVAVRVAGVERGLVLLEWDRSAAGVRAAPGEVFDGRFLRRAGVRGALVGFGEGLHGRLEEGGMPWGLPYRSWPEGAEVRVCVVRVLRARDGAAYELAYAGPAPARRVEEIFRVGNILIGLVEGLDDRGAWVLLGDEEGEGRVEVVGRVPPGEMTAAQVRDPASHFPRRPLRVRVVSVDAGRREVILTPAVAGLAPPTPPA